MARPRLAQPGEEFVPAGAVAELGFHFQCAFMPGSYFANTGVMGVVDGKIKYLHRLVDRLMFRVQDTDVRGNAGDVDLFLQSHLEYNASAAQKAA